MTHDEVVDLLEELFNAYPNNPIKDAGGTIRTWEREFGSDDAGTIYKAARHHMNTNRYFPNVADIRKSINKGQMLYGKEPQEQPLVEAPQKLIQGDVGEEAPCRLEHCILYHDLCNGLNEKGECPFE